MDNGPNISKQNPNVGETNPLIIVNYIIFCCIAISTLELRYSVQTSKHIHGPKNKE